MANVATTSVTITTGQHYARSEPNIDCDADARGTGGVPMYRDRSIPSNMQAKSNAIADTIIITV